jgi:endonuclease/exonuclease/phosphatase family metal-dependent hydrolase
MFSDSHRNRILSQLRSRYPSRSRRLGEDRGAKQDGGVVILSRWPIANCPAVQKIFDVCDGTDCGAEKGVLYVRIVKEGQPYNIFGTHLNAGSGANATNVRLQQLRAIKRFIDEQRLAKTEPVIIAGDFNIDKSSGEYASLLSGLNVTHPPLQPGGYSPATEPRGQYFEARDCPRPGQHYLDYILVSKDHKRLAYASNEALMPCTADGGNLSDHYPVLGRFTTELVVTPIPPE